MEEQVVSSLVNALIALIVAHPKIAAAVAAVWGIAQLWKAQPKEKRDELTKRSPRAIGVIRAVLELAPDLVGFVRVIVYQVFKGLAARGAPPPERDRSSPGFSEAALMRWIAGVSLFVLFAAACCGCPIPPPDGCPPRATRCSPSGVPQACTLGQYWSSPRPETPCPAGSVCCYARSPYGRALHACVPQGACLAEPPPPDDAGLEGGAQ